MQVKINALPKTIAEFETLMKDLKLTKRENTCALFLCALYLYTKNVDDGIKALNLLRGPRPMTKMDEQFIRDRLRGKLLHILKELHLLIIMSLQNLMY